MSRGSRVVVGSGSCELSVVTQFFREASPVFHAAAHVSPKC